jgi:Zn-dependent membrane protease YugP
MSYLADKYAAINPSTAFKLGLGTYGTASLGIPIVALAGMNMSLENDADDAENKALLGKIASKVRKQGTGITYNDEPLLSFFVESKYFDPKYGGRPVKGSKDTYDFGGIRIKRGRAGDAIYTGRNASIFAHEYGHSLHHQDRGGGLIGSIAHQLYAPSKIGTSVSGILAPAAAFGMGIAAAKGRKFGKFARFAPIVAPAAVSVPMLVAEEEASRQGLKALREVGASDDYLSKSRRRLGLAYSTYLAAPLSTVGLSAAAMAYGKTHPDIFKKLVNKLR